MSLVRHVEEPDASTLGLVMGCIYIPEQDEDAAYDDWRQRRDDDAAEEAAYHELELLRRQQDEEKPK